MIIGRRSLALFALLFIFWTVICEAMDLQHIAAGLIISFAGASFWHILGSRLPALPLFGEITRLLYALILLVGYIIYANIAVARTLLFSKPPVSPIFVTIQTNIGSNWGRILLAACITITPGTITVDADPDTGIFIVHALTEENAVDLLHWRLIGKIIDLETWRKRRGENALDSDWNNHTDSSGAD